MPEAIRIRSRHYDSGLPVELVVRDGLISEMKPASAGSAELSAPWIAPGLFDLQINGAIGFSFNAPDLTADQIETVVRCCHSHGISSFCPTLITASTPDLIHGFTTLEQTRRSNPLIAKAIPGYHLEGPWINPDDGPRGAHPRDHVRLPDWDEFLRLREAAGGRILLVTLAPELAGAVPFIEKLTAVGVVVAIGHTAADALQIEAAVAAGARLSTHLGNGCSATIHRHSNPIWPQLGNDQLWASLIADGHHLPPAMLRSLLRAKSPFRTILTCDASSLAGLPPGHYSVWSSRLEILNSGKIVLSDTGYLAGSGQFTDSCLTEVLRQTDLSLSEAIGLATTNPRKLLNQTVVEIAFGAPADLMLFDWQPGGCLEVQATILAGQIVYRREESQMD